MSYLVLARKWRPKMFKELVGQEVLSQTLKNAVIQNRVAQAFLFCGSRGTGKTSCARILAKALACQNTVDGEPCGVCKNCQVINQGHSTDIVEIDAASNRGIENIRKIRENLAYLPIQNKFKVYIIDEAHMLTLESFNALLKSLEEPPAHVKFILATTEPKKIPHTIQSRCQRYEFHNISEDEIKIHLSHIAKQEGMEISNSNLKKIAKNAYGAMRDALTSLDMLIAFCGTQIKDEDLSQILEITENKDLEELLSSIIKQNTTSALLLFKNLCDKGIALQTILSDLLLLVHKISLLKSCPQSTVNEPLQSVALQENIIHTSLSKLQQYFQILLEVEQQGRVSQFPMLCVEMGIIKMCSVESLVRVQDIIHQLEKEQPQKEQVNVAPIQSQNFSSGEQKSMETNTVTEQNTTESNSSVLEPPTEKITEPPTEKITEPPTEKITEPPTEKITEPPTEKIIEPPTEKITEPLLDSNVIPNAIVQQTNKQTESTTPEDWKNQNPPNHNLQEEPNSQNNHNQQSTTATTYIKDRNFENYERFVTDLKNKYPNSIKIKQLEQLKFQKFMDKKLTLDNNEPLSFWTDEYKMELENYLMQFFGEKIEVSLLKTEPTENTEPTEKLSEDIAVSTAQEIFKV